MRAIFRTIPKVMLLGLFLGTTGTVPAQVQHPPFPPPVPAGIDAGGGEWRTGAVHNHTVESIDGHDTVFGMMTAYLNRGGYQWVTFTDHAGVFDFISCAGQICPEEMYAQAEEIARWNESHPGLQALQGMEMTTDEWVAGSGVWGSGCHVLALPGLRLRPGPLTDLADVQAVWVSDRNAADTVAETVLDTGGFAVVNHPGWGTPETNGDDPNEMSRETWPKILELLGRENPLGVEVHNTKRQDAGTNAGSIHRWVHDLLLKGARAFPVTGFDAHSTTMARDSWGGTVIHAEGNDRATVLDALRRGRLFCSSYDMGLALWVSDADGISNRWSWMGERRHSQAGQPWRVRVSYHAGYWYSCRLRVLKGRIGAGQETQVGPEVTLRPGDTGTLEWPVRVTAEAGCYLRAEAAALTPSAQRYHAFTAPVWLDVDPNDVYPVRRPHSFVARAADSATVNLSWGLSEYGRVPDHFRVIATGSDAPVPTTPADTTGWSVIAHKRVVWGAGGVLPDRFECSHRVPCGQLFFTRYLVQAVAGTEHGPWSPVNWSATVCPPLNVTAHPWGKSSVRVAWDFPASGQYDHFHFQAAPAERPEAKRTWLLNASVRDKLVDGLPEDSRWVFTVRALRHVPGGDELSGAAPVTGEPMYSKVRNLRAAALSPTTVRLSWEDNREPGHYLVRRRLNTDSAPWVRAGTVTGGPGTLTWADPETLCGDEFQYQVGFHVNDGVDFCDPVTVRLPMLSVENLVAKEGSGCVEIGWTKPGCGCVDGFTLERREGRDGPWRLLAEIPLQNFNVYKRTDGKVICNTAYTYRVRPFRDRDSGRESGPAAVVSVQTDSCP